MKATQQFAVSVAGILLVGGIHQARADVVTSFQTGSGTFAVDNWNIYNSSGNASDSSPSPDTLTFTLPNTANTRTTIDSILTSPQAGAATILNAILSLNPDGDFGPLYVQPYFSTDSQGLDPVGSPTLPQLSAESGGSTVYESLDITIPAGDYLNFEMAGGGNSGSGGGPAVMDLTLIPEAGSWQAGVFLAGLFGVGMVRNLRAGARTQP